MKAITLWEPWATLVAHGHKRYETRHWTTRWRGNIAIHAAKRWKGEQLATFDNLRQRFPAALGNYTIDDLSFGCVVVACRLVAIHRVEDVRDSLSALERACGNYADGRYAWELKIVKLPPAPVSARGQQGLWEWQP